MSAVLLITPLMLATAAPAYTIQTPVYSHATQTALGATLASSTAYCFTTTTFSGTQTFAYDGKPTDSDNDSDQRGDC
ncbi:MAG: hypothetical protein HEQ34_07360 [Sphingorhabdus sp.]|jgi:hypothetical protein|uniref:hypothetical protein n=1 Tax=Sphingorhabdus sp. TaxID=1902408 RepID=UPI0025D76BC1|nr:hypothetical protein [Sphingorhabdus sp.]MCO4091757.1 hypothetical protein [Sphingorhabdus sp.]